VGAGGEERIFCATLSPCSFSHSLAVSIPSHAFRNNRECPPSSPTALPSPPSYFTPATPTIAPKVQCSFGEIEFFSYSDVNAKTLHERVLCRKKMDHYLLFKTVILLTHFYFLYKHVYMITKNFFSLRNQIKIECSKCLKCYHFLCVQVLVDVININTLYGN